LITSVTAAFALAVLLQLPGLPNCPSVFWPLAPASLRLECARLAASKQTAKDLLEAIALVDSLPLDHPLRSEADRLVELWSQDVLRLAEELFNKGKLSEAIAAARHIPAKASSAKLVEKRVNRWQSIWSKAEEIYRKAENELRNLEWRKAFALAVRLLDLDNEYWQTTKFNELNAQINIARDDGNKLGQAQRLADQGGLTSLLDAIKLAESIRPKSYVYQAAQTAIAKFGRKMLDLAQTMVDQRDLNGALMVLSKIPSAVKLEEEIRDATALANAQAQVWGNTVSGVEEAIAQAQRIAPNRPLYAKAQQLIARWQLEIEALAQLEKARLIAQTGDINDLTAAIAQLSQISTSNPRGKEIQQQIQTWQAQIETIQDGPILEEAEQLANPGDVMSLQAAVEKAKQIRPGRSLSSKARSRIQQWVGQIQRIEDQPYLDQAQEYARSGNLSAAIATAEQIKPGRTLYNDAQAKIRSWRDTIQAAVVQAQAQQNLQDAYRLANSGSSSALVEAIQVADRVPPSSKLRGDADTLINQWSQQLLDMATTQAGYDITGAIALAQKIPARAQVYGTAQNQIASWKKLINAPTTSR
jgi:hypothetical protein